MKLGKVSVSAEKLKAFLGLHPDETVVGCFPCPDTKGQNMVFVAAGPNMPVAGAHKHFVEGQAFDPRPVEVILVKGEDGARTCSYAHAPDVAWPHPADIAG